LGLARTVNRTPSRGRVYSEVQANKRGILGPKGTHTWGGETGQRKKLRDRVGDSTLFPWNTGNIDRLGIHISRGRREKNGVAAERVKVLFLAESFNHGERQKCGKYSDSLSRGAPVKRKPPFPTGGGHSVHSGVGEFIGVRIILNPLAASRPCR